MKDVLEPYKILPGIGFFQKFAVREYVFENVADFDVHRRTIEPTRAFAFTQARKYNGLAIVNFERQLRAVMSQEIYLGDVSGNTALSLETLQNSRGDSFFIDEELLDALTEKESIALAHVRGLYSPSLDRLIICTWKEPEREENFPDDGFGIPDHWAV